MHTWRTIIAGFIEVMMSHMVKNRGHTHLELNRLCTVFYLVKLLLISVFNSETKMLLNNRPNRHQRLFQICETFLNLHSRLFLWNVVSNDQSAALNVTLTWKCGSNASRIFATSIWFSSRMISGRHLCEPAMIKYPSMHFVSTSSSDGGHEPTQTCKLSFLSPTVVIVAVVVVVTRLSFRS